MFGLFNRGELDSVTEHEFEHLIARLKNLWLTEHNEDGTHRMFETDNTFNGTNDFTLGVFERGRDYAMGSLQSYSVAWTNLSGGSTAVGTGGSLQGYYTTIGKRVFVDIFLTIGTGASLGTAGGLFAFSTPSTVSVMGIGTLKATNTGVANFLGATIVNNTTTVLGLSGDGAGGVVGVTTAAPFAWGNTDTLTLSFSYFEV